MGYCVLAPLPSCPQVSAPVRRGDTGIPCRYSPGVARKDTLLPRHTHRHLSRARRIDAFNVARPDAGPSPGPTASLDGEQTISGDSALAPKDMREDGGARSSHVLRHGSLCPHNLILAGSPSQLKKHLCSLVDPRSAHRVPAGLETTKRGDGEVALQADGVLGELLISRLCLLVGKKEDEEEPFSFVFSPCPQC